MGTGTAARTRRVICQYKFSRYKHDNRVINAMITRAEKITTGATAMAKARFVKVTWEKRAKLNVIARDRNLARRRRPVLGVPRPGRPPGVMVQ